MLGWRWLTSTLPSNTHRRGPLGGLFFHLSITLFITIKVFITLGRAILIATGGAPDIKQLSKVVCHFLPHISP
jgi:hypothetical protein